MFGLSNCTISGTIGARATRSWSAFSRRTPGRQSRWLCSGFDATGGLRRNGSATRSAASVSAATLARSRALRTTRKPSSSNDRRCSSVSRTKSTRLLPDHTAVLHLVVHRRQDLRVREEGLHLLLRNEGVAGALLLRRQRAEVLTLDVQLFAVDEDAPRGGVGALAQLPRL